MSENRSEPAPPPDTALVLSDVDGTLVTPDKVVTPASRRAVERLRERGIGFTVTSSRPGFGLRTVVEALAIDLPFGAFNGASIVRPDLSIVEERLIPQAAAVRAVELLVEAGTGIWVFADGQWLATDPDGAYVERERRAIQAEPSVVADFAPYLDRTSKIVGVSGDFEALGRLEAAMRLALGTQAYAARSQHYYLDVTPPGRDKGTVVDWLAAHLGIAPARIVTIGDMDNDVAMFRKSGFSFAMGNGSEAARRAASALTAANTQDGFAAAMERVLAAAG